MRTVSMKCLDEVLVAACQASLSGHSASPRNIATVETIGFHCRLTNPRARWIYNHARRWNPAFAIGELCWHLTGSDAVDVVAYYAPRWYQFSDDGNRILGSCYGKRIFSKSSDNATQWERIKRLLRADPSTRRAVITFPEPGADAIRRKDLPCIIGIQFLIRSGHLNCLGIMRSNDVIWGMSYDLFFITMLQEILALELGVPLGWYEHFVSSLHIYERHYELACDIVTSGVPNSAPAMEPMSNLEAVQEFLAVERSLRLGDEAAPTDVRKLPPYWRRLAIPLVDKWRDHEKTVASET